MRSLGTGTGSLTCASNSEFVPALKRGLAGQALVSDAAQAVHVDAAVDRTALNLFRRHVVHRADDRAIAGQARDCGGVLGKPEVAEIRVLASPGLLGHQNLRRA